jgi:signal transduction histidine kinase
MDGMEPWNLWMYLFCSLAAVCLCLIWIVPTRRGRGPRAVGLGAALVPAATLCVLAFGVTAPSWTFQVTTIFDDGHSVTSGGSLLPGAGQLETFWLAVAIVVAASVFTLVASRQAAYLAAVILLAFGLWQAYVALKLHAGLVGGYYWYDFMLRWTDRLAVWLVALASVASGSFLAARMVVADALARRSGLTAQVQRLTVTRAAAVDAAAAELRRLERDLHDGAQARLVALGINLRTAERLISTSPDDAATLVAECRESSAQALAELRNLVRGIYPPVLADRGLGDAVRALALDCPVPAVTDISLPGRPPAPVESAVYFAIAEVLNNVAKHADASCALVRVHYADGMLRAEIIDNGNGGAVPGNGTGLAGIERRLSAFDGILAVNSPVGGPTIVVIEVPCALSSPKISIS